VLTRNRPLQDRVAGAIILNAMYDLTTGINVANRRYIATSANPKSDPVHEPSWFMRERIWSRTQSGLISRRVGRRRPEHALSTLGLLRTPQPAPRESLAVHLQRRARCFLTEDVPGSSSGMLVQHAVMETMLDRCFLLILAAVRVLTLAAPRAVVGRRLY